jgi:hypothetical protein
MSVDVRFEDGPAAGQQQRYEYLSIALPSLAWTTADGRVEAVYHRRTDRPDASGVWPYYQADL